MHVSAHVRAHTHTCVHSYEHMQHQYPPSKDHGECIHSYICRFIAATKEATYLRGQKDPGPSCERLVSFWMSGPAIAFAKLLQSLENF